MVETVGDEPEDATVEGAKNLAGATLGVAAADAAADPAANPLASMFGDMEGFDGIGDQMQDLFGGGMEGFSMEGMGEMIMGLIGGIQQLFAGGGIMSAITSIAEPQHSVDNVPPAPAPDVTPAPVVGVTPPVMKEPSLSGGPS